MDNGTMIRGNKTIQEAMYPKKIRVHPWLKFPSAVGVFRKMNHG